MNNQKLINYQFFLDEFNKKFEKNDNKINFFHCTNCNNKLITIFLFYLSFIFYIIFKNYIKKFLILLPIITIFIYFSLKIIKFNKYIKIVKYLIILFLLILTINLYYEYLSINLNDFQNIHIIYILILLVFLSLTPTFNLFLSIYIDKNEKVSIQIIEEIFNENNIYINSKNLKILLDNVNEINTKFHISCIDYLHKIFKSIFIFFFVTLSSFFIVYIQNIFLEIAQTDFEYGVNNIICLFLYFINPIILLISILIIAYKLLSINKIIYIETLKKLHLNIYLKE